MRLLLLLTLLSSWAFAQPSQSLVDVIVTPGRQDWTYKTGQRADFEVQILKNGQLLPGVSISYRIGPEQMPPEKEGARSLPEGKTTLEGMALAVPGFVRCEVSVAYEGHTYRGWGTAGFAPEAIQPTVRLPDDFRAFWQSAKAALAELPLDARVTLQPDLCTPDIKVYHVSLQNVRMRHGWRGSSRFYGMLSVPAKAGKYPAILNVPGAGIRPYGRDDRAAQGLIVLKVGIHGIPVNMEQEVYESLGVGALAGYHSFHLEDRDEYYYKRVYLGCVRAIDYIFSLPEFDGENLAVTGGSQGGALSIVTAGLDERVKYLAAFYPALSDLPGYLEGRAGGWPHMYREVPPGQREAWLRTTAYYDVVNFARQLTAPGWYSWGYNDNVCPPTSMYAAYNVISAPKELHPFLETAHWTFPEQRAAADAWLMKQLGVD